MEHNVYDFDGTIYRGDSTLDFYLFCLYKKPEILFDLPKTVLFFVKFKLRLCKRIDFKAQFYSFLLRIDNVDNFLDEFWNRNFCKVKNWYFEKRLQSDIIISASPEFLLVPVCKKLNVENLIASKVDASSGRILGENCRGLEKVRRIQEEFSECNVNEFYSDSLSDTPMAKISQHAFFVKGEMIGKWKF